MIGKHYYYKEQFFDAREFKTVEQLNANRIYEVLRVMHGRPVFFADHFERFKQSLSLLNQQCRISADELRSIISELLRLNNTVECNIRFELLLSETEADICVYQVQHKYPPIETYQHGVLTASYSIDRKNPHIKQSEVNNRIRKEIADLIAQQNIFEVILVNHFGNITEGSRSNVLFLKENKLYSPKSEEILEGITRKKVLELAKAKNIEVVEKDIPIESVSQFESAFITGTSPKVLPIRAINRIEFNISQVLLLQIMKWYDELLIAAE